MYVTENTKLNIVGKLCFDEFIFSLKPDNYFNLFPTLTDLK